VADRGDANRLPAIGELIEDAVGVDPQRVQAAQPAPQRVPQPRLARSSRSRASSIASQGHSDHLHVYGHMLPPAQEALAAALDAASGAAGRRRGRPAERPAAQGQLQPPLLMDAAGNCGVMPWIVIPFTSLPHVEELRCQ
jgi:hypothetical protein